MSPVLRPQASVRVRGVHDPATSAELRRLGYARAGQVLAAPDIAEARAVFDEARSRLGRPIGSTWFPTILLPEVEVSAWITEELSRIVAPRLESVLDRTCLDLLRVDFSVKPPGEGSALGPHQDFALVDETRTTSLYLWLPLEDTTEANGTLHVVPGSHRFANQVRSQHVPARFDDVLDLVHRRSVALDCRAGELVLMVAGVIHHSPANRSDHVRLAAHGIAVPLGEPLVFFYADEATPSGRAECFEVDIEDYIHHIGAGRPTDGRRPTRLVDRPPEEVGRAAFEAAWAELTAELSATGDSGPATH